MAYNRSGSVGQSVYLAKFQNSLGWIKVAISAKLATN